MNGNGVFTGDIIADGGNVGCAKLTSNTLAIYDENGQESYVLRPDSISISNGMFNIGNVSFVHKNNVTENYTTGPYKIMCKNGEEVASQIMIGGNTDAETR
jgi:tRNA splicing ligase